MDDWSLAAAAGLQLWMGKARETVLYTDRCGGLLEAGKDYLRFKVGKRACTVWGKGLHIVSFDEGRLLLSGEAERIELD